MNHRQKKKKSAMGGFLMILGILGVLVILVPFLEDTKMQCVMDTARQDPGSLPYKEAVSEERAKADEETDARLNTEQPLKETERITEKETEASEPPTERMVDPVFLEPMPVLVNKDNPLPPDYEANIVDFPGGRVSVSEEIAEALTQMLEDGRSAGLQPLAASGYRSRERQQEVLDIDIQSLMNQGMSYEDAYEQKLRTIMPPGYSEHETGLAVDIVSVANQRLDDTQESTPENQWLRENCTKYGFILRYPREKEEITKISYESWHFRYVGATIAAYIKEHDLTLEEFAEEYKKAAED